MSHVTRRAYALILSLAALATPRLAAQDAKHVAWEWGFHGVVLMNAFYNDNKVNNSDLPLGVSQPDPPVSLPNSSLGATIRQTRLIGTADLAGFAGGDLHTELDVDFWGGQLNSGRTGPVPHVRRAFGEVTWDRASLLIGQEGPLVADVNPTSLATLGIPGYTSAGNLWYWIPQIRFGYDLTHGNGARIGVQAALLDGMTEEMTLGTSFMSPTRAERSGRPMVEGRLRARWGSTGEIGVGGHLSWLATTGDSLLQAKGFVVSGVVPLTSTFELRGEWYTGQGLSGLGGGAIGQPFNSVGEPLKDNGGWGQLNAKAGTNWVVGVGYGYSDPKGTAADEGNNAFKDLNTQYGGRIEWRYAPAVVAFEYRHLATTYGGTIGERAATHLNLAMGIEF